jgi:hypothetical protein
MFTVTVPPPPSLAGGAVIVQLACGTVSLSWASLPAEITNSVPGFAAIALRTASLKVVPPSDMFAARAPFVPA